ncbi:MAG: hypothetical protein WCB46_12430, partial [Methanoregula sp.]
ACRDKCQKKRQAGISPAISTQIRAPRFCGHFPAPIGISGHTKKKAGFEIINENRIIFFSNTRLWGNTGNQAAKEIKNI